MTDIIAALLPPVVVAALFVALVITALRATDWAQPGNPGSDVAHPNAADDDTSGGAAAAGDEDKGL